MFLIRKIGCIDPEKLLFIVLNTKAKGYSNLLCHIQVLGTHWKFTKQTVSMFELTLPSGLSVQNFTEQIGDENVKPENVKVQMTGSAVQLTDVVLDDENPARFFAFDIKKEL